jgi:hypothetical protein
MASALQHATKTLPSVKRLTLTPVQLKRFYKTQQTGDGWIVFSTGNNHPYFSQNTSSIELFRVHMVTYATAVPMHPARFSKLCHSMVNFLLGKWMIYVNADGVQTYEKTYKFGAEIPHAGGDGEHYVQSLKNDAARAAKCNTYRAANGDLVVVTNHMDVESCMGGMREIMRLKPTNDIILFGNAQAFANMADGHHRKMFLAAKDTLNYMHSNEKLIAFETGRYVQKRDKTCVMIKAGATKVTTGLSYAANYESLVYMHPVIQEMEEYENTSHNNVSQEIPDGMRTMQTFEMYDVVQDLYDDIPKASSADNYHAIEAKMARFNPMFGYMLTCIR